MADSMEALPSSGGFEARGRQVSNESTISATAKLDNLALGQQRVEWALAELRRDVQGVAALLVSSGSTRGAETPGPFGTGSPADFLRSQTPGDVLCCEASLAKSDRRHSTTSVNSQTSDQQHPGISEELQPVATEDAIDALQVAPSLPLLWPASLCMRQGPDIEPPRSSFTCSSMDFSLHEAIEAENSGPVSSTRSSRFTLLDLDLEAEGCLRRLMINPSSSFHAAYTILVFAVLMYDLIVTPYAVAWEVEMDGFFEVSAWMSCLFWSCDIIISFLTGYTNSNRLEMRPWQVAVHFAKTWFVPDIIFVGCDWMAILLGYSLAGDSNSSYSLRVVRFAKLGKMLRIMGIFRMMKVARMLDEYLERSSAFMKVLLRCLVLFLVTLWVNHLVGCVWFALGKMAPADTGMRWTQTSRIVNGVEHEFENEDVLYQYITSVHWSVAQFTLGAIEIGCYNTCERLFNILCLMLGLLFGSTLVSILSATMVEYQMMRQDLTQKLRKLRRFLRENNVNPCVSLLVQQQASERLQFVDRIQEKDVKVLELLSRDLRTDLRFDIAQPHLCTHPLFRLWTIMDVSIVRALCTDAMEDVWLLPQDDMFVAGTTTDKAFYLTSGQLIYTQSPETSGVQKVTSVKVEQGKWLSEASLWLHWIHVGTAKADVSSHVMALFAEKMTALLRRNRDIREITLEYRRHFHRRVVVARPPENSWPSDLDVPCTEYGDLVFSMDREIQVAIGQIAIDQLIRATWHRSRAAASRSSTISNLHKEVHSGRCCLMVNASGQVERVVSVVALHIETFDGHIFVELGQVAPNMTKAACQLPGAKADQGELASETLQRILARLRLPTEAVTVTRTERQAQWKRSQEYGVQTRYLRSVHFAVLTGQLELPVVVLHEADGMPRSEKDGLPLELAQTRVYVAKDGLKRCFYAWLPPSVFEHLRGPEGEAELRTWMAVLGQSDMEDISL